MGAPPQVRALSCLQSKYYESQIRDSGLRAQVSVRNTSRVMETQGASLVTVTSQTVHMASPSLSMSGRCVSVNP